LHHSDGPRGRNGGNSPGLAQIMSEQREPLAGAVGESAW
jgi:hypothetical protein